MPTQQHALRSNKPRSIADPTHAAGMQHLNNERHPLTGSVSLPELKQHKGVRSTRAADLRRSHANANTLSRFGIAELITQDPSDEGRPPDANHLEREAIVRDAASNKRRPAKRGAAKQLPPAAAAARPPHLHAATKATTATVAQQQQRLRQQRLPRRPVRGGRPAGGASARRALNPPARSRLTLHEPMQIVRQALQMLEDDIATQSEGTLHALAEGLRRAKQRQELAEREAASCRETLAAMGFSRVAAQKKAATLERKLDEAQKRLERQQEAAEEAAEVAKAADDDDAQLVERLRAELEAAFQRQLRVRAEHEATLVQLGEEQRRSERAREEVARLQGLLDKAGDNEDVKLASVTQELRVTQRTAVGLRTQLEKEQARGEELRVELASAQARLQQLQQEQLRKGESQTLELRMLRAQAERQAAELEQRTADRAKVDEEVQHLRDQLVQMRAEGGLASSTRSLSVSQSHASASALSALSPDVGRGERRSSERTSFLQSGLPPDRRASAAQERERERDRRPSALPDRRPTAIPDVEL